MEINAREQVALADLLVGDVVVTDYEPVHWFMPDVDARVSGHEYGVYRPLRTADGSSSPAFLGAAVIGQCRLVLASLPAGTPPRTAVEEAVLLLPVASALHANLTPDTTLLILADPVTDSISVALKSSLLDATPIDRLPMDKKSADHYIATALRCLADNLPARALIDAYHRPNIDNNFKKAISALLVDLTSDGPA